MIKVVDSIMGSGKTTCLINMMNEHPEQRYLYVTPYLAEVDRITSACSNLHFCQPSEEISKTAS